MKRTLTTLALLTAGFVCGQLNSAAASDPAQGIVQELRGIKDQLTQIRRAIEAQKP